MERFTASGSPQQQRPCTFHSNIFIPFSPKPRHPREPNFTSNFRPPADHHLRRLPEDTELSVFDPERYFNGGRRQTQGRRQNKGLRRRQQTGMLSDPPAGPAAVATKTSPLSKQRWRPSSTCAWPLRGSCPCFRSKAVEVEEKCPAPRRPDPDHLDFHGIGSASLNKAGKAAAGEGTCVRTGGNGAGAPMENELGLQVEKMAKFTLVPDSWIDERDLFLGSSLLLRDEVVRPFSDGRPARSSSPPDEPTRHSLEVFQPAEESSTTPRGSVEFRRRAMKPLFPGDAGPRRSSTFPGSPVARVASVEDELASDSSSDLFEIESFSTQTTPSRPSHTRGGFGDKAATTPRITKVAAPAGWSSGRVNATCRRSGPGAGSAVGDEPELRSCRCEEARSSSGPGQQHKHARHERPHHTTRGASSDGAGHVRASLAIPPAAGNATAARTNWARASSEPPLPAHSHVSASPAGAAGV